MPPPKPERGLRRLRTKQQIKGAGKLYKEYYDKSAKNPAQQQKYRKELHQKLDQRAKTGKRPYDNQGKKSCAVVAVSTISAALAVARLLGRA